jgi:antitoxin (DNA-binding transcriptional repressor) of toxin-antitoxin stability system
MMKRYTKVAEFKRACLALIDQAARTGALVVVAEDGEPVAELVSRRPRRKTLRGILKNSLFITGDIISPIDTER